MDMTKRLAGQVALVTGGGTGIGAATARRLVAEGAAVVLAGRRREPLAAVAAELGDAALVVAGDAADTADVERMVDAAVAHFDRLDLVVANAGGHGLGTVAEIGGQGWGHGLRTNVTTPFVSVRTAQPPQRAQGG
uniref:SDR family oxidoreductase n=1 Tax=Nocardia brasiliensis TaxID=37326 RepID=UPI0024584DD8